MSEQSTRLFRPPAEPPAPEEESGKKSAQPAKAKVNPKWTPFEDKASLPKDVKLDKKGKVMKPGSMQYATITALNGTVKLVGYFRNGKGLARRMVKILKPQKKNSRGAADRAFLKQLRVSGVKDVTQL